MGWDLSQIRVASFKGVEFPCVLNAGTQRSKRWRLVEHTNRPGGLVWDGTRKSVTIDMTAVFGIDRISGLNSNTFGLNWRKQAEDLIKVCDAVGPGTLVHPVWGEIWSLCVSYPDDIQPDAVNQVRMRLQFVECSQSEQAWKRVIQILNPDERAEVLATNLDASLGLSGTESFGFHIGAFLALLVQPQMTLQLVSTNLAATVQSILALAESIDVATNPLYADYVLEAQRLTGLVIEAADMHTGHFSALRSYWVAREMTLSDVAAECGCSEDEVLRYNSIPDPLEIRANQYLIVPA